MNADAPQPRTLEVSLVWAREAMAMRTYTNVVLYVFVVHKNEMRIACFLGASISKSIFSKVETLHAALSTKCNFR